LATAVKVIVPVALIVTSGAALAVPKSFSAGETLTAAKLNENFSDLNERVTELEKPTYVTAEASALETPGPSADLVYQAMHLDLTPGTWLVTAQASVRLGIQPDTIQLALWNDSAKLEVPGSRGPWGESKSINTANDCDYPDDKCSSAGLTTTTIVTVSADTALRVKVLRNGYSQLYVGGTTAGGVGVPGTNRMTAVRLD
jgi:hypothetical protein